VVTLGVGEGLKKLSAVAGRIFEVRVCAVVVLLAQGYNRSEVPGPFLSLIQLLAFMRRPQDLAHTHLRRFS
jgi:hypothetical protein